MMIIRRATPDDARAIAEVHVRAWQAGYRGVVPEAHLRSLSVERREEAWRQALTEQSSDVRVAEEGGRILAWISAGESRDDDASAGMGELWAVYVDPPCWRRGLGRALWQQAEAHLRGAGYSAVTLWVLRDNAVALRFYEALGFAREPDQASDKTIEIGGIPLVEIRLRRALAPADPWEQGDPYDRYIGRWSRLVAPRFLSWLGLPGGKRWLDVGCGTGALCAAIRAQAAPASVVGVEPSAGFLTAARRQLGSAVPLARGGAPALPLAAGATDVVASGLVLNFVADPAAALAEMARVTSAGGTIAAYVWDYAGGMQLTRAFWDGAAALDPAAAPLHEGARFPLCQPAPLAALFTAAGLEVVEVTAIDVPTPFATFADYWDPFLGGQGPAPGYLLSLDPAARARLRTHLERQLPVAPDGSLPLTARAWAVRGRRA
jgi:ribosomal protein S18 acetylase RimI-like enzyme